MKYQDFLREKKEKRERRRKVFAALTTVLALLSLLFLIECERPEEDGRGGVKTSKRSVQTDLPKKAVQWRKTFANDQLSAQAWASPLQQQVSLLNQSFAKCFKKLGLEKVEWIFSYNPRSGTLRDNRMLSGKDLIDTNEECLTKLLSEKILLPARSKYEDDFFEIQLTLK